MQTENTNYIYKNDLHKACFQHDIAYGNYRNLVKRTKLDKVLRDKAFRISSNLKYHCYERRLGSMVYNFFDKKSSSSGIKSKSNQLTDKCHKPIIGNFKRFKVYFPLKDII